jgi:hypothetical protein
MNNPILDKSEFIMTVVAFFHTCEILGLSTSKYRINSRNSKTALEEAWVNYVANYVEKMDVK